MYNVTFILLVIAGLNWLLQGLVSWEIGELFGGQDAMISRIIYVLVGLSAIYQLVMMNKGSKTTSSSTGI